MCWKASSWVGDIGIVTTIFHNSALPSQSISGVPPFVSADVGVVARAVDEISVEFPTTREEYATENQVYPATGLVLGSYRIFSKTLIDKVSDLDGRKVAGAGINLRYLEGIKGVAGVRGSLVVFVNADVLSRNRLNAPFKDIFEVVQFSPVMIEFVQLPDVIRVDRLTRSDGFLMVLNGAWPLLGARCRGWRSSHLHFIVTATGYRTLKKTA